MQRHRFDRSGRIEMNAACPSRFFWVLYLICYIRRSVQDIAALECLHGNAACSHGTDVELNTTFVPLL